MGSVKHRAELRYHHREPQTLYRNIIVIFFYGYSLLVHVGETNLYSNWLHFGFYGWSTNNSQLKQHLVCVYYAAVRPVSCVLLNGLCIVAGQFRGCRQRQLYFKYKLS